MNSNEMNVRLDDFTRDCLDKYAGKHFKKPNGEGNRTEALRHILTAVFQLQQNPLIVEQLDNDLVLNGDILVFIRKAISHYIAEDDAHTLA